MLTLPTEAELNANKGDYYSTFSEGCPFGMLVDDDPIMIFIEFCDPDGPNWDAEPFDIPTNEIIEKWIEATGRVPVSIGYGDCTYYPLTKDFVPTRYQWRPARGQEDWIYTGTKFVRGSSD